MSVAAAMAANLRQVAAANWQDDHRVGLNYQSIGSGGGIKQIKAKTVTFGARTCP